MRDRSWSRKSDDGDALSERAWNIRSYLCRLIKSSILLYPATLFRKVARRHRDKEILFGWELRRKLETRESDFDSSIFPSEKPLVGFFEFYVRRPKNLHRKKDPEGIILHTRKPDSSNFLKLIEDVLEGLIYKNDSQFFLPIAMKFYTSKTGSPHQKIRIYEITN